MSAAGSYRLRPSGVDDALTENIELRRKVAVLERSLRRQAALTADAELRLARACPRNSAADSNIKSMVLELEHSRTASTNLQRSNRQLQAELEAAQLQLEEYKHRNENLDRRLQTALSDLEARVEDDEENEDECTRLEQELRIVTSRLVQANVALAQAKEDAADAERKKEHMKREMNELYQRLDDLEKSTVDKVTAERLALEASNAKIELEMSARIIQRLQDKQASLERSSEARQRDFESRLLQTGSVEAQLRASRRREEELAQELQDLQRESDRQKHALAEAHAETARAQESEDKLRGELRMAADRLANFKRALEETVTDESGASDVEEDDYSEGEEEEEANVAPMVVREAEPQLRQWRETEAADNTKGEEEEDQDQEEEAKIVPEVARRQWRETEDSSNTREEEEEEVVSTQSLVEDTKSAYARKLARLGLEEEEESVSSSTRALVIDGEGEE